MRKWTLNKQENNVNKQVELIRDGSNIIADYMSSDKDSTNEENDEYFLTQTDMFCEHEDHKSIEENAIHNEL